MNGVVVCCHETDQRAGGRLSEGFINRLEGVAHHDGVAILCEVDVGRIVGVEGADSKFAVHKHHQLGDVITGVREHFRDGHHHRGHRFAGESFRGVHRGNELIEAVVHAAGSDDTAGDDITGVVFVGDDRVIVVVNQQTAGSIFDIDIAAGAVNEGHIAGDLEQVGVLSRIVGGDIVDKHGEGVGSGNRGAHLLAEGGVRGNRSRGVEGEGTVVEDRIRAVDGAVDVGTRRGAGQGDGLLGVVVAGGNGEHRGFHCGSGSLAVGDDQGENTELRVSTYYRVAEREGGGGVQSSERVESAFGLESLKRAAVNHKTDGGSIAGTCSDDGETRNLVAALRHQGHGVAITTILVGVETQGRRNGGVVVRGSVIGRVLGTSEADDIVDVTCRNHLSVLIALFREDKRHLLGKGTTDCHQRNQHDGSKSLNLTAQSLETVGFSHSL